MYDSDNENSAGGYPGFNINRPHPDRPSLDRSYPGRYSPVTINKNKPVEAASVGFPSPFQLTPNSLHASSPVGGLSPPAIIPESYWLIQFRSVLKIAATSVLVCYLLYFSFLLYRRWYESSCVYRMDTKVKLEQAVRASVFYPQGHMVTDDDWLSNPFS